MSLKKLKDLKDYVLYDTETSGLDLFNDRIIEHGCMRVRNDEIVDTLAIMVKQPIVISEESMSFHGISNEVMNAKGLEPKKSALDILEFMGDDVVMGLNNISYDGPILMNECNRYKLKRPLMENWFDVGLWHKGIHIGKLWNEEELFYKYALRIKEIRAKGVKYNLNFLAKNYDVENLREGGIHGAIKDLKMTKHVFDKMKEKYCL